MGPGGPLPTRALDLGHRQSRSGGEPNKPRVRINLMAGAKMIDVPARRTPRRVQPGGGHRVPISPPARKENHEEMKRTGAQSWCFLWGKLVFVGGMEKEMTERRGHARTYVLSVTRADAKQSRSSSRDRRGASAAPQRRRAAVPARTCPVARHGPLSRRARSALLCFVFFFDGAGSNIEHAVK